jgi:hypothetical protein
MCRAFSTSEWSHRLPGCRSHPARQPSISSGVAPSNSRKTNAVSARSREQLVRSLRVFGRAGLPPRTALPARADARPEPSSPAAESARPQRPWPGPAQVRRQSPRLAAAPRDQWHPDRSSILQSVRALAPMPTPAVARRESRALGPRWIPEDSHEPIPVVTSVIASAGHSSRPLHGKTS